VDGRRGTLLRLAVAVGLTAFVLYKSHPADVLHAAAGADLRWIALAIALTLADRTLMAYRWLALLCVLTPGTRPSFGAIIRVFFVSTFVATFLPSVGGDVYRAYALSRLQVSGVESAASVLMDRMLGVLSILIAGVAALVVARGMSLDPGIFITLGVAALACTAAAILIFSDRAEAAAQGFVGRLPHIRVQRLAGGLLDAMRRYSAFRGTLLNVIFVSILVQVIRIVQAYCLGQSLGIDASIDVYFVLIPIVLLIMLLPITVNGLGTSQAAFPWLFGQAGVAAAPAVALSILFVALGIVGNLPGGMLYAFGAPMQARDSRTS
jgi:glycosyltransferase 2 family protein